LKFFKNLVAKRPKIKKSYTETKAAEETFKENMEGVLKLNKITGEARQGRKDKKRKAFIKKLDAAAKAAKEAVQEANRKANCSEGKTCN